MVNWRPILRLHNINILYNGSEKPGGDARTIELEGFDIGHTVVDEWRDERVLHFRKTDVDATLLKKSSSPIGYQNQETVGGPAKICATCSGQNCTSS